MDLFNDCRKSKENQVQADVFRLPLNVVLNLSILSNIPDTVVDDFRRSCHLSVFWLDNDLILERELTRRCPSFFGMKSPVK